ncbi:MAG TPA: hypothetical protein VF041_14930 [Gemmatimonadaceae bacterium]
MSRRAKVALGVVALWLCGMAALARRELFRGTAGRLARAALFVEPGAQFYQITDGGRQIGFASSTIDTTARAIQIEDLVVADLPGARGPRRLAARSRAEMSRTLRLRRFAYQLGGDAGPYTATGTVEGDTALTVVVQRGSAPADTQRVRLDTPLLLPTMVPMAIALGETPSVGERYTYAVFDPIADSTRAVTLRIAAESLFVLADSAMLAPDRSSWVTAHRDTVRAWRVEEEGGGLLTGWIDGAGRMVEARPLAMLHMKRTAYELAFQNWSRSSTTTYAPATRQ